jgi:outer membrane protein, heavy metal efflux system
VIVRSLIGVAGLLATFRVLPAPPPLPPPRALDAAVAASPVVHMARAGLGEAAAVAAALKVGPHEWSVRVAAQNRNVLDDRSYPEWDAGIERGLRWAEKKRLDLTLAETEGLLADAKVAEVERDQRIALLEAWFGCLSADHRATAADAAAVDARRFYEVVVVRHNAGDASRSDLDLATADLAAAEAEQHGAIALAESAASAVRLAGLDAPCRGIEIPDPPPGRATDSHGAASPAITRARVEADKARFEAERAKADQRPDPIIGLRLGTELGGTDRLATLSVTIPIGGARRLAETARANARARALESAVAATERQEAARRLEFSALEAAARARYGDSARDATARRRAADTLVRGYELGDGDLATIALMRRDAHRAELITELSRIEAWRGATIADLLPELRGL